MELKKENQLTELGLIPSDWKLEPLSSVADVVGGGTPSTVIKEYWNGGINWFTPTEIGLTKYVTSSLRKISPKGLLRSSASILPIGSILLTTRASIGEIAIAKEECCTNQGFQSLIPFPTTNAEFLFYALIVQKKQLLRNASGSTFLEISPGKVKKTLIPFPSQPDEQTAIATALSDMDALIAQTEKLIEKKKAIKLGVMQKLLSPVDENGKMKKGWSVKSLSELVTPTDGIKIGPFGSALKKDILVSNGYKVYGQENVFENDMNIGERYIDRVRFLKLRTCELLSGDFVVSMMGTIGKCMIVPENYEKGIMDSHLIRIRLNSDLIDSQYLLHFFSTSTLIAQIKQLSVGGIMDGLSSKIIKQISIPHPTNKNEQTSITKILNDFDAKIDALKKKLNKERTLKQGMMQSLLTGEIRIYKPKHEPATVRT